MMACSVTCASIFVRLSLMSCSGMKARWYFQSSRPLCVFSLILPKDTTRVSARDQSHCGQAEGCWGYRSAKTRRGNCMLGEKARQRNGVSSSSFFFVFFLRNARAHRQAECVQQEVGLPLICVSEHMSAQPPPPPP